MATLKRELGLWGAVMMGLGSIVGTGVFVSIGIAAGITGPSVLLAIAVAAFVATCNGLSSAQLAASHPVSGGTYEYGYRYLSPTLGFTAGWLFLCAKSASAATAALGFAAYLLPILGASSHNVTLWVALGTVLLLTAIVLTGMRRTNIVNIGIVSITLLSLAGFVLAGLPQAIQRGATHLTPLFPTQSGHFAWTNFLEACALMFVAYTGYGRIATLGEEVQNPRRTIPIAMVTTLGVSMVLYLAVGYVGVATVGTQSFHVTSVTEAAPLANIAKRFSWPGIATLVSIGAMTAMLGVLLNLLLGLSRVMLAMGRRADMPKATARLNPAQTTPTVSVLVVSVIILLLIQIGNVKTIWSFSAFTVLMYYALTNIAALRLAPKDQLYPRTFSWMGLFACLFLAFWVEWKIWLVGLGLIAAGLLWKIGIKKLDTQSSTTSSG